MSEIVPRHCNPLALHFVEALHHGAFLKQIETAALAVAEQEFRTEFIARTGAAGRLALAGAKFITDKGTLVVEFSKGIPKGAKIVKDTAGQMIPLLRGQKGQFIQQSRVVAKSGASVALSSALIVVELAHIISNYDLNKRLKSLEKGMARLLAMQESELKSRLEAIYRYAKEIAYKGADNLTEDDRRELHRQSRDLMELRGRWRDDFICQTKDISTAKVGSVASFFGWFLGNNDKKLDKEREQKAAEFMAAGGEVLGLMNFSLTLQMALAGLSGRLDGFTHATLRDESFSWRLLADHTRQRSQEVCGARIPVELEHFCSDIEGLSHLWSPSQLMPPDRGEFESQIPQDSPKKKALKKATSVPKVTKTKAVAAKVKAPVGKAKKK
jgi:hypothetical protein